MGLFDRIGDALGLGTDNEASRAAQSAFLITPATSLPGGVSGAYGSYRPGVVAPTYGTGGGYNPLLGAPVASPGQPITSIKGAQWGTPKIGDVGGNMFAQPPSVSFPAQGAAPAAVNPYANDNSLLGRLMAQQWAAGQPTPAGTSQGNVAGGAGSAGAGGNIFSAGGVPVAGGGGVADQFGHALTGSIGDLDPTRSLLRDISTSQTTDPQIMQALQGAATSNLGANTGDLSQQFLALMREQAAPYEQQQRNAMNQNLFSRGRLGGDDSVTGEAYRQFARGQSEADITRQLGALQFGQGEAQNMFERGLSASGAYDQLQTSTLGRILGASGGAQDLTRLGTLPLELALQFGIARSNALTGQVSGLNQVNAGRTSVADLFGAFLGGGGGAVFGGGA